MAAILENLKYDPSGLSATNLAEDQNSEGKFGIPRFGGQPSALQEYAFRVRSKMHRESKMDESEVKKLGPLGLRLVEGLRGDALKLAQQLKMEDLSKSTGPDQLLKLFAENLKPRKAQEARELFAAGSKDGGILSRQQNEPMSSYVMRRRAWWSALQDLEEDMRVSETILSEQLLMNAGITEDQRLMVRTMLQGNMSFNRVAEELLAQHPRLHDRERRQKGKGHGKGFGKPWRKSFHHNRSYWGESHAEEEDDWDAHSQSLTGYTAECEDYYENEELYDSQSYAAFEGEYVEEYEHFLENHMALLSEGGFDIDNDEACALAAESIQLEYEAYNVRSQAKGKGIGGFGTARHFEVSGQLSLQERKARLQLLKSKTECRRCGQRGHWSGDPQCPKGSRRQDGSTGGKPSSSKSSSGGKSYSGGKKGGNKPGQNPKPRVVYFALGDSGATSDGGRGYMALRSDNDPGDREQPNVQGVCIPPPSCLGGTAATSRTMTSPLQSPTPGGGSAPLSLSSAFAHGTMFGSPGASSAGDGATGVMMTSRPRGLAPKSAPRGSRALPSDFQVVPFQPQESLVEFQAGMMNQGDMTAEEELGERLMNHWNQQPGGVQFDVNLPPLPEFQPLHNQREVMMAQQHVQQALATLAAMEVDDNELPHKSIDARGSNEVVPPTQQSAVSTGPAPAPLQPAGETCRHLRTTKKGSNAYVKMVTCIDCNQVISRIKAGEMSSAAEAVPLQQNENLETSGNPDCRCLNVTWRGSNGYRWKKTCLDCGKVLVGAQTAAPTTPQSGVSSQQPHTPVPSPQGQFNMTQVQEILRSSLMVASVKAAERPVQCLEMGEIHRILDVVSNTIPWLPPPPTPYSSIPTTPTRSPQQMRTPEEQRNYEQASGGLPEPGTAYGNARMPTPGSPGDHPDNRQLMNFGKYKNKPFWYAYTDDDYVDWCLNNVSQRSCRGLKKFVDYIHERNAMRNQRAFMAAEDENEDRVPEESDLVAILDLGCNKTCHGSKWFKKYLKAIGGKEEDYPLQLRDGSGFVGIGGKIEVNGNRHMSVGFELCGEGIAVGTLVSTELKESDAPLLLSISDQRKLGLVLELGEGEDKVYSNYLQEYLHVVASNGLLGIRLLPSQVAMLSKLTEDELDVASTTADSPSSTQDQKTISTDIEPYPSQQFPAPGALPPGLGHCFLELEEGHHKVMSKGQKKMLDQATKEMKNQDMSLWSALCPRTRSPLPKGCQVFLMEVFAGAALLSHVVAMAGYQIATPVDLALDGANLLDPNFRKKLDFEIEAKDPYVITFAPVCGPWGPWSRLNMSKSEKTAQLILDQRDKWYPTLKWMTQLIKKRLQRGRKVLVENPWSSELWSVLCFDKLIQESPQDAETLEFLELVRADLCEYGLQDQQSGLPHYKPTGFLTASATVKERLSRRCQGNHWHQPLEGGQRTRQAQQWSQELCEQIFLGFEEELHSRNIYAAFYNEELQEQAEEEMDFGSLDSIMDEDDLAQRNLQRDGLNEVELHRQEEQEELPSPPHSVGIEVERKRKWLMVPKTVRIALRRLHNMTGHSPTSAMVQLLRTSGASSQVVEAARHFACETCRKRQPPQRPNVVKPPSKMEFNHEIAIDCLEVRDSYGNRHTILSVVCVGTLFHQAFWVAGGGVPKSAVCAKKLLQGWFAPFGAPKILTCDRGVHNRGRLQDLLRVHGVQLRYTGVEAPYQLGRGERQGGLLKNLLKTSMEERNIIGVHEVEMLLSEAIMVKNCRINHAGFTPAQWVLGKLPVDRTSLSHEEADGEHLGVQAEVMDPSDEFTKTLEIRQAAKIAFAKVDSSRRIRAAMLRKSVPLRGPYSAGDLVCFHRKERWHGPCRVIGKEGRSTYWLVHGGVPLVVPEGSMRPASSTEVIAKHILEMRPSRKRMREAMRHPDEPVQAELPFEDDLLMMFNEDGQEQPSYVELPLDLPAEGGSSGGAGGAVEGEEIPVPGELPVPIEVEDENDVNMDEEQVPVIEQPESEMTPSPTTPQSVEPPSGEQPPPGQDQSLTTALRRSTDQLDGHPMQPSLLPPPGLSVTSRERSRSPLRDAAVIPVPDRDGDAGLLGVDKERKHLHCFLAKRYMRKPKQGAGKELSFQKCSEEVQQALMETRKKEWGNWKQFKAVKIIPPSEVEDFVAQNPEMEILPTRWLEVNKAEVGETPKLKSRIIVRGDLEKNNSLRTDSPTTSQLFLNIIISYSSCTGRPLGSGDISAAFLQGTGIARVLAFRLPPGGVPDQEVEEGSLMMAEKAVYGTRDAPRGFWKGLHETLLQCGLKSVPLEQSAYYLPGAEGEVCGLMGAHVDDLLWCGNDEMERTMKKVQEKYKFGSVSDAKFKFCGRVISQSKSGIKVTCPNVMDRVKAVYVDPARRKHRAEAATASEISQLRSVIGSLAWLSRVCRPDISFAVNQLQSVQQSARVQDLLQANKLLSSTMASKEKGIFYPSKAFAFEKAVLISVNDASHAASFEEVKPGYVGGHRSQSGRLLLMASPDFVEKGEGLVHLLEWHSTTIRRVCRSTLQAETLSMQLGAEECEHVRQILYYVKNNPDFGNPSRNYVNALDHMVCVWATDCRSLSDHLVNPGMTEVSDKRLAIDLTSLRQEAWRMVGEAVGNPTFTDSLPSARTTIIKWVSTATMVADALTKEMKPWQLDSMMESGQLKFSYEAAKTAPHL